MLSVGSKTQIRLNDDEMMMMMLMIMCVDEAKMMTIDDDETKMMTIKDETTKEDAEIRTRYDPNKVLIGLPRTSYEVLGHLKTS